MKSKPSAPGLTRRFTTAAVALFLAGCFGLEPVTDTTRYYTLVPAENATATTPPDTATTRTGVRVTVLTDHLRRAPIAVRIGANEVRFANDHRWAERVDKAVELVLTSALQQRLDDRTVFPVSNGVASGAAVIIDVAIAACEGTADGAATLEGYWRINSGTDATPAATGHFLGTRPGWGGTDYGELAGMLGALVDELAVEIAGHL